MKNRFLAVSMLSLTLAASAFAQTGKLGAARSASTGDAALRRLDLSREKQVFPFMALMLFSVAVYELTGANQVAATAEVPSQSVESLFDR